MTGRALPVYLASPLGFTDPTRAWYAEVLLPAVTEAGLTPVDPWVGDEIVTALRLPPGAERLTALREANRVTGARNAGLIDGSAGVFAVLDGPDVDSGTAAEIGYAAALGKPVVGWRSDFRSAGDNEAAVVNLQVEHFLSALHRDLHEGLAALAALLATV